MPCEVTVRGWKVFYSAEEGSLTVGPTRGKLACLRIVGVACSAQSAYSYLAFEIDDDAEDVSERHEEALREYLDKNHAGPWDLVPAQVLTSSWPEMNDVERERVLKREGFRATSILP